MRMWWEQPFVPSYVSCLSILERSGENRADVLVYVLSALWWCWCGMTGDWSPGAPLQLGNGCHWKLNMLQQWTQCNSVHPGTLGSIQDILLKRCIKICFCPWNFPPVQHTNRWPVSGSPLRIESVWPLSHFAAMRRHFLEPTLNTFVKKFLPWQFRHCSQGYWSIS